jgi:hypothetical protein
MKSRSQFDNLAEAILATEMTFRPFTHRMIEYAGFFTFSKLGSARVASITIGRGQLQTRWWKLAGFDLMETSLLELVLMCEMRENNLKAIKALLKFHEIEDASIEKVVATYTGAASLKYASRLKRTLAHFQAVQKKPCSFHLRS